VIEREVGADPERLRAMAARMRGLADAIGDARRQLERVRLAEGRCWGGDEAGAAFAATYGPASRLVDAMLARTESGVHGLAAVLTAVTSVVETADREAGRMQV
jgi:uncharacterized protein YukE